VDNALGGTEDESSESHPFIGTAKVGGDVLTLIISEAYITPLPPPLILSCSNWRDLGNAAYSTLGLLFIS